MAVTVRVLVLIPKRLLFHGLLYLQLVSDYFKTLESLAMNLNRVISSPERFTDYENLFKTNPAVQKAIGTLYGDVIDLCTRMVRFYSRSSVRSYCPLHLWNPVTDHWQVPCWFPSIESSAMFQSTSTSTVLRSIG